MSEAQASPPPLPAESPVERVSRQRSMALPAAIIFLGVTVLALVGTREARELEGRPWAEAILAPDNVLEGEAADVPGVIPVRVRDVSRPGDKALTFLATSFETWASKEEHALKVDFNRPERVMAAALDVEDLAPLLASGRLPEPGRPEVLAGDLARADPFEVDGVSFQVTGRLKPHVSGLLYSYLLPLDAGIEEYFTEATGATQGWLHPEGLAHLDELLPNPDEADAPELLGLRTRTRPAYAWVALAGLMLVAWGGAMAHIRVFANASHGDARILGPLLTETVERPRLFAGMHVALYGTFFACMVLGLCFPLLNYRLTEYVGAIFTEGGLSYVGDAYRSQNILQAALATYYNNYVVQTLGFTFLPSVVPLALGAFKTAASFALAGFVMAPVWAGSAAGQVFHSITMALELEAYILASFVVLVWPIRLVRGVISGAFSQHVARAAHIYIGGIVLTGAMLAIAALYEATSLILLW